MYMNIYIVNKTVTLQCFLHHKSIVISRLWTEMSLVNIVHRCAFFLNLTLLFITIMPIYINACTIVHLSAFQFASIDLALVCFTHMKATGVPENYVS